MFQVAVYTQLPVEKDGLEERVQSGAAGVAEVKTAASLCLCATTRNEVLSAVE